MPKPERRRRWPIVSAGVPLPARVAAAAVLSLPGFAGKAAGARLAGASTAWYAQR